MSYSHSNPSWTAEQERERLQQVHRFVAALRTYGIDADADIFHENEDWTRWGPGQVEVSNFVLIVVSEAWKDAWVGAGDPMKNKGVRAEANAVKSIEHLGGNVLQQRCRLILLPNSSDEDIPLGMHGLMRHYIKGFDFADLEGLLRDLTKQPKYVKPALGEVPILPPAMTTHTPEIAELEQAAPTPAKPDSATLPSIEEQQERIEQLKSQLAALPEPLPGEGPHLPWFRLRQQIESLLFAELRSATGASDTDEGAALVQWVPTTNLQVVWADQWRPNITCGATAVALHLIPVPQIPLSQRTLSLLDDTVTRLIRDLDLIDSKAGLTHGFPGDDVIVEADLVQLGYSEVSMGEFLGLRAGRSGQVSLWYSLPRDGMGSVLDEHRLKYDLAKALGAGAKLLESTYGESFARVAIAAELINTTSLTGGALDELGSRSQTTLPGAFGKSARIEPDESVARHDLLPPTSWSVAGTLAKVLVRGWTR